jgi:predicted hydrocarbon binding protein
MGKENDDLNSFRDALLLKYYDIVHDKMSIVRPKMGNEINVIFSQMSVPLLLTSQECRKKMTENGEFIGNFLGEAYCDYAPLCPETSKNLENIRKAKTKKDIESNTIVGEFKKFMLNSRYGILEIGDFKGNEVILRLRECGECCGLPVFEEMSCLFILGMFKSFFAKLLGKKIESVESKCKGKGDEFCEFVLKLTND